MQKTLKIISTLYLAFLFIAGWIISFPKQDIILQLTPLPPLLIFIYWIYNKKRQDNMTESPKERDTIRSCVIEFILKVINIICIGCMVAIGYKWTLGISEPLAAAINLINAFLQLHLVRPVGFCFILFRKPTIKQSLFFCPLGSIKHFIM